MRRGGEGQGEMDDILMRRYVAEKNNRQNLEIANRTLERDNDELKHQLEEALKEDERNQAESKRKEGEQKKMVEYLQAQIRELQMQMVSREDSGIIPKVGEI